MQVSQPLQTGFCGSSCLANSRFEWIYGPKGNREKQQQAGGSNRHHNPARHVAYLYEDALGIFVRLCHPLHQREGDPEGRLQALHLNRQTLLLPGGDERRELPGVALQLGVSELMKRSDVRQLPLRFHQQGQLPRIHPLLWDKGGAMERMGDDELLPIDTC